MRKKTKITLIISLSAMMIALQLVFERYLSITIGTSFRIGTTFIARAITGMCLNLALCGFCSLSADVLGAFIFWGGQVNPIISLAACIRGLIFGYLFKGKKPGIVLTFLTVIADQIICGGVITTIGLIIFGGSPNTLEFWGLRFLQSAGLAAIELPILLLAIRYVFPRIRSFLNSNGFYDNDKKEDSASDNR